MTMKREVGWAVAGNHGLYVGWSLRRVNAICEHVNAFDPELPAYTTHRYLSLAQKKQWAKCKRRGDRVVKVELRYE